MIDFFIAHLGHEKMVEFLIQNGADVNLQNSAGKYELCYYWAITTITTTYIYITKYAGKTPLHVAVSNDHEKVIDTLIKNEANITIFDYDGLTPLLTAVQDGMHYFTKRFKVTILEWIHLSFRVCNSDISCVTIHFVLKFLNYIFGWIEFHREI